MQSILKLPQVCARTRLAKSTIYRMMGEGTFPRPVKLNLRANGWPETEIADWIESRIALRDAA